MQLVKIKSLFYIFTILTIFSCTRYPAPIVDNSDIVYRKSSYEKYFNTKHTQDQKNSSERYIKIKSGDNLYKIAKQNNSNIKDIINRNNLVAPFILPIGKKIFIPVLNTHIVKKGDSLYSISRLYNVNINKLTSSNNLSKPYMIRPGQTLTINGNSKTKKQISRSKRKFATKKYPVTHTRSVSKAGFSWPVKGRVISAFGPQKGGLYNDGVNIKASTGSVVKSSQSGTIAYVGNELKGYGNLIIIKHPNKMITAYGHLGKTKVKRGQTVAKQQVIAFVGSSGNVNSSQLYFGLRRGRDAINPQHYLKN